MVNSIAPRDFSELQELVRQRIVESSSLEFKRELPPAGKNDDLGKELLTGPARGMAKDQEQRQLRPKQVVQHHAIPGNRINRTEQGCGSPRCKPDCGADASSWQLRLEVFDAKNQSTVRAHEVEKEKDPERGNSQCDRGGDATAVHGGPL